MAIPTHFAAVHAELVTTQESLEAQLRVTRDAIAAIHALAGGTPARPAVPEPASGAAARPRKAARKPRLAKQGRGVTKAAPSDDATMEQVHTEVRALLKDGPVAPAAIGGALGLSRYLTTRLLDDLERRGVVRVTGSTINRRVALAGRAAAKEVP